MKHSIPPLVLRIDDSRFKKALEKATATIKRFEHKKGHKR